MTIPVYPLYLVDIAGSTLVIALSLMSVFLAYRLFRGDRENIFWMYLLWLSGALTVFALSRGVGHILQYVLVYGGFRMTWNVLSPLSGSLNTLSFVFVGAVSLFFVAVQKLYQRLAADRKRIETINVELMNLNQEMETLISERTLSMIALSVADRVRNPATVIGGTASRILKTEGLEPLLKERLADFLAESQKLDAIVKDYEAVLRRKESAFRYEDLGGLIGDVLSLIEAEARTKGVDLHLDLPEEPARFNANAPLIKVAVAHILKNAVEATDPGGKVTTTVGRSDDKVFVRISDTGRGIPAEDLKKIFSLFFSTKKNRIGMGLPLVKQIVEEHQGEITVESRVGAGTTFQMIFPVRWLDTREVEG
ncbi:MAG: sensor histidine kinase [Chloroflexota bacterium]